VAFQHDCLVHPDGLVKARDKTNAACGELCQQLAEPLKPMEAGAGSPAALPGLAESSLSLPEVGHEQLQGGRLCSALLPAIHQRCRPSQ